PRASRHSSVGLDVARCNQRESFLSESRPVGASRSSEDRSEPDWQLFLHLQKTLLAFSARAPLAANFVRIAWPLRSRSAATSPAFVPLLFYQDRQSCVRKSAAQFQPRRS